MFQSYTKSLEVVDGIFTLPSLMYIKFCGIAAFPRPPMLCCPHGAWPA